MQTHVLTCAKVSFRDEERTNSETDEYKHLEEPKAAHKNKQQSKLICFTLYSQ